MNDFLPPGFRSDFVHANGIRLHLVHNGPAYQGDPLDDPRQPILLLHGFPEFWFAWEQVARALGGEYLILIPDQRGYNRSEAPEGREHYKARILVQDMIALTEAVLGDRNFTLGGHDWGASIAYALAINFPERIDHLLIANGVHPACFQKALLDDPAQARASAYFHILRSEQAPDIMAADNFAKTFSMFEKFSLSPWMTPEIKQLYAQAYGGQNPTCGNAALVQFFTHRRAHRRAASA